MTTLEPDISAVGRPELIYQNFLEAGIFALPHCERCGRAHYSPRLLCPHCGSAAVTWVESSGLGTLYSASTIAPREDEPYVVALVDLAEGPRMMSRIVEVAIEDIQIGMPLRAQIRTTQEGPHPMFTKAAR